MGLKSKTHKSQQVSSCLRLNDKHGQSYKMNREQRRKNHRIKK